MKIIKYILILIVLLAIGISIWYFVFVSELSNKGKMTYKDYIRATEYGEKAKCKYIEKNKKK